MAMLYVVAILGVMLGFVSLAVDLGRVQTAKTEARRTADAVSRAHLEVRDGNPAISMYRNAGFSAVGRRRNYYRSRDGQQFDAITFALNL